MELTMLQVHVTQQSDTFAYPKDVLGPSLARLLLFT